MRRALDGVADAEPVKHVKDVRPELNAVADGAKFLRLLEHAYGYSLAAQCERRRQIRPATPPTIRMGSSLDMHFLAPPVDRGLVEHIHHENGKEGNRCLQGCHCEERQSYSTPDPLDFPLKLHAGSCPSRDVAQFHQASRYRPLSHRRY